MSQSDDTGPVSATGPDSAEPGDGAGQLPGGVLLGSVEVALRPPAEHPDEPSWERADPDDTDEVGADWAWVDEWRQSGEPPAWGPGVTIAVFVMLVVGCAVFVLSQGLGDMPWLAVAANVVVAAGLAPALWLCRSLPVLRFLAAGAMVGVAVGWIAALMS